MNPMELFRDDIEQLICSLSQHISLDGISRVRHLLDHGETFVAISSLASIIVNERKFVPASAIESIKCLLDGTDEEPFLPKDLDKFAIPAVPDESANDNSTSTIK
jgi:hypothetical protein